MRLYTFSVKGNPNSETRTGVETESGKILDINLSASSILKESGEKDFSVLAAKHASPNMLELIGNWDHAKGIISKALKGDVRNGPGRERALFSFDEVRFYAPLLRPWRIHDFMVGKTHVMNSFNGKLPTNWEKFPVCYKGNPDSIIGPEDKVKKPRYTEKLDYELELGMIIGKKGIDVTLVDAPKYIFGYTIFNDYSARDIQFEEMAVGLGPFKGKDFATAIGPCIVTADEMDPTTVKMTASVNGEMWSSGYLNDMEFSFPEIIEYLSSEEYIFPGDLIGSGTIGGGCGLELGKSLKIGDEVVLEVEKIGKLRNYVVG
ncbi:MAG: fumarylacetoacetate hydrolase family protein [Thermoplasmataceae archaeon]